MTAVKKKKKSKDSLGDRMKMLEHRESFQHLPLCPIVARMDGRSFHTFTKDLERPFDIRLSRLMIETTRALVAQTNAVIGYTQSDEITLVFCQDNYDSDIFFDGNHDKMVSTLSSITTGYFNRLLPLYIPGKHLAISHDVKCSQHPSSCKCGVTEQALAANLPMFDARVFTVPTLTEAANCLVWREQDATRNSVQMAARSYFDHDECHLKKRADLMDMLYADKNINWNDYPTFFKRGTYLKRQTVKRYLTDVELDGMPPHVASKLTDLEVSRSIVAELDMPPYNQIEDRVTVYFGKE